MKGQFRIGGAVLFGVLVILGAFMLRDNIGTSPKEGFIVAAAPERTAIRNLDADGNGIADWEESLGKRAFEAITAPTTTILSEEEEYEKPTTLTGRFSEAFVQDYFEGKIDGVDFSDPSALVGSAVEAIDSSVKSRRYTRLDTLRTDTSSESVRRYGNEIMGIMQKHSIDNENEAVILQRALAADDPKLLEPLAPILAVYQAIVRDSLLAPVPEVLIDEHIAFLNAAEAIRADVQAMQLAFTDPLYALARMRVYESDATALLTALTSIAEELRRQNADYANNEPGAIFYLFEQ